MPGLFVALAILASRAPVRADAAVTAPTAVGLPLVEGPRGAPLVVVDAGHGGRDPGSVARGGLREKAETLAAALAIRRALLAGGGIRVALTRREDRTLRLDARREMARLLDARLFLSIHCDSTADPAVHGASILTLAAHPPPPAGPGAGNLPAILTDLADRQTEADAQRFAGLLAQALHPLGILKPDHARAARLRVLRAPDVPSVLLETGYLSNPADARRLRSPRGQWSLAAAVAVAVAHFLRA